MGGCTGCKHSRSSRIWLLLFFLLFVWFVLFYIYIYLFIIFFKYINDIYIYTDICIHAFEINAAAQGAADVR